MLKDGRRPLRSGRARRRVDLLRLRRACRALLAPWEGRLRRRPWTLLRARRAARRPSGRVWWVGIGLLLAAPVVAVADEVGGPAEIEVPVASQYDVVEDPILAKMRALDEIAPFEDLAPLWDHRDAELQRQVEAALRDLALDESARRGQLGVALIDISKLDEPRVAAVNGDAMMYAASLPKIAVLLAAFELIAQGKMTLDAETERTLELMIRESSNTAATEMMHRVGKAQIAHVLLSPRYRLYDPKHNGGLWVGKDYAKAGLWRRDPLHNLSHGATAMQVARFYYLLQTGNLVTPEYSEKMKEILADTKLEHKFARVLRLINPAALLFRKSGSWRTYHSDSVLVERDGRGYIAVALSHSPEGQRWLQQIIVALDGIIFPKSS